MVNLAAVESVGTAQSDGTVNSHVLDLGVVIIEQCKLEFVCVILIIYKVDIAVRKHLVVAELNNDFAQLCNLTLSRSNAYDLGIEADLCSLGILHILE